MRTWIWNGQLCKQWIEENEKYCKYHLDKHCEHEYDESKTKESIRFITSDLKDYQYLSYVILENCKKCGYWKTDFIFDKSYNLKLNRKDFIALKEMLEKKEKKNN